VDHEQQVVFYRARRAFAAHRQVCTPPRRRCASWIAAEHLL